MFHERYLICAARQAATTWSYRSKLYFMNDGGTAFMEPGETHCGLVSRKPASFVAVFVDTGRFLQLAEQQGCTRTPHFPLAQLRDPQHLIAGYKLANALREQATALELQTRLAVLTRLALEYAEEKPAAFGDDGAFQRLNRTRDFLRDRFEENVNLEDLAVIAALSPFHLLRSFTKRFGLPPHAYQIHVRIKRACRLLRAGLPCVEVASSVGFADQSHFARHFKRIMGIAPSMYAHPPLAPAPFFF
jgi:AraC-like DNA-binding protein